MNRILGCIILAGHGAIACAVHADTLLSLVQTNKQPAQGEANAVPAAGNTRSWYLRNEIGGNIIPDISLKDKSFTDGVDTLSWTGASLSMDAGVGWNIAFGTHLNDWLAIEVSSGLAYNQFSSVSGTIDVSGSALSGSVDVSGSLLQVPVMAGPRVELPVGEKMRVNLGVSVGGIYMHGDLDTTISDGVVSFRLDGSDGAWAFAYSATAGVDWELAPGLGLGVAYRFLGTTSASFGPIDAIEAEGVYNQQVLGTITLRF